jgi:hypothetical protein
MFGFATCLFSLNSHASVITSVPILPSLHGPTPTSLYATTGVPLPPDKPGAGGNVVAKLAHFIATVRSEGGPRKDNGPRDPTIHDPARERDATSLGVICPPMSGRGAALAGVGAVTGAAALILKIGKSLPIRIGPVGYLGGGGIALRGEW